MSDAPLSPTEFLDFDTSAVGEFVGRTLDGRQMSQREMSVHLYYAVRDDIFYEVADAGLSRSAMRASAIAGAGQGFCLHKSILYAAAVRSVGIPSRIGFANVRNHVASNGMRELVGGDVFFHAYVAICLDDRWLRLSPVFNKILCALYGLEPLDFDGQTNALLQPFYAGSQMEFMWFHGEFADFPYEFVLDNMRRMHPRLLLETAGAPGRGGRPHERRP